MSRHQVTIFWSDEDQAFIAEVTELAVRRADGAALAEALASSR